MKIGRIIHQQVIQLRWHFLACLGLLMAMPIEEAFINLKDGEGFYATHLSLGIPLIVAPLLAGLIACGNVQADLDDRRYIFWRSKPVGVKSFVALKFIIGLLVAIVVFVSAPVFVFITYKAIQTEKILRSFYEMVGISLFISVLTYSMCFFCNVLVRKTARAWLIGMAITVFLLLVPFILPLNYKDMAEDFFVVMSVAYLSVTIGPSIIAFVVSLFAASHNWHLQTNLKGLLWTGAALIFLVMLLFTRQVANIKVLDEVEIPSSFSFLHNLQQLYDRTQEGHLLEAEISNDGIEFNDIYIEPSQETLEELKNASRLYPVQKGLHLDRYPTFDRVTFNNGNDTYRFKLNTYYYKEKVGKRSYTRKYKKAYLCGYKLLEGLYPVPVSALDLSDCFNEKGTSKVGLRQIEDKLVVLIQDSIAVVQIKADGGLEIINKEVDGIKGYSRNLVSRDKIFKIPLLPIQNISIEERIKLTLDVNYRYYHIYSGWRYEEDFCRRSLVDLNGDTTSYCLLNEAEISRFDVVKWNDESVYCRFRDKRPFTFLEQMFGRIAVYDSWFVKDGKLYAYENHKLMVFDIRSDRIRKLGHFERISENFKINDIEVLEDGNILMNVRTKDSYYPDGSRSMTGSLYLLKNPE